MLSYKVNNDHLTHWPNLSSSFFLFFFYNHVSIIRRDEFVSDDARLTFALRYAGFYEI